MAGTRNDRLLRRTLFVSVVAITGLLAAAPVAAADPCPVLDPGCVVENTTTTAGGVVENTTTTAGGVVEDTTSTAGGVVEGVVPVDPGPIVGGIVPDGILPGNGSVLPGGGDTPPGGGTTPPGGESTPPGGGGSTPGGGTQAGPSSSGTQHDPAGVAGDVGSGSVLSSLTGDASTTVGHPFQAFLDDASGGPLLWGAHLARTFAFPLALILLVTGFVFAQNRIDRKDPKLALAPVGSDYLTFS